MSDFAPSDLWFNLVQVCQPPRYFELTDLRGGWCDRYVKPLLAHSTTSSFTCNRLLCIVTVTLASRCQNLRMRSILFALLLLTIGAQARDLKNLRRRTVTTTTTSSPPAKTQSGIPCNCLLATLPNFPGRSANSARQQLYAGCSKRYVCRDRIKE